MKAIRPIKMRPAAKIYRLIRRKQSRFIAVRLRNGKQRSRRETEPELAKAFAYRWLAQSYPTLARELGLEITPELKGFPPPPESLAA